jgi:hypothetical protein
MKVCGSQIHGNPKSPVLYHGPPIRTTCMAPGTQLQSRWALPPNQLISSPADSGSPTSSPRQFALAHHRKHATRPPLDCTIALAWVLRRCWAHHLGDMWKMVRLVARDCSLWLAVWRSCWFNVNRDGESAICCCAVFESFHACYLQMIRDTSRWYKVCHRKLENWLWVRRISTRPGVVE